MAIKASATITLSFMVDVKAVYRYYKLQASTASPPGVPTSNPPLGWTNTEPTYAEGSTNTLYFVDLTVFSNDEFAYSSVSKSSSYEAAKEAYNKAVAAGNAANEATGAVAEVRTTVSNMEQDLSGFKATVESDYSKKTETTEEINSATTTLKSTLEEGFEASLKSSTKETLNTGTVMSSMAMGEMLYKNATFKRAEISESFKDSFTESTNLTLYKCTNTDVTIEQNADALVADGRTIKFTANDWNALDDNYVGGFSFDVPARLNGRYVCKLMAKVPAGYSLECIENVAGTDSTEKWIGENKVYLAENAKNLGTGEWTDYYFYIQCGASGTVGNLFNICVTGNIAPTAVATVEWKLCFATVYDITNVLTYEERIAENEASITLNKDNITQLITKTTVIAQNDGGEDEELTTTQEVYNKLVSTIDGTTQTISNRIEAIDGETGALKQLEENITTIQTTADGLNAQIQEVSAGVDGKITEKLAEYEMSSEQWSAKFKEALEKQDEDGHVVGSTVGETTISAKGVQFQRASRRAIFNTDEINVYEEDTRIFGIQRDSVYANRLYAPNGADFGTNGVGVKFVPLTINGVGYLCITKTGGAS